MPNVTMLAANGPAYAFTAPGGVSLMKAAVSNDVPGIVGECGGEMTCATCHVHVTAEWKAVLSGRSDEEEELLEMVDDFKPCSRLSCQIKLTDELNGLTVVVPQS
jgi:ferredoxin, 2Fe-2S